MNSKGFRTYQQALWEAILCAVNRRKRFYVPPELLNAIEECKDIESLKDLLFSTDFIKNEGIIQAFDKRMDQLLRSA